MVFSYLLAFLDESHFARTRYPAQSWTYRDIGNYCECFNCVQPQATASNPFSSKPQMDRIDGTSGRTRTATPVKAMDFESIVSTNFTTLALRLLLPAFTCQPM
jgi:hypothetical protein